MASSEVVGIYGNNQQLIILIMYLYPSSPSLTFTRPPRTLALFSCARHSNRASEYQQLGEQKKQALLQSRRISHICGKMIHLFIGLTTSYISLQSGANLVRTSGNEIGIMVGKGREGECGADGMIEDGATEMQQFSMANREAKVRKSTTLPKISPYKFV